MRKIFFLVTAAAVVFALSSLAPGSAAPKGVQFSAKLSGANEVPPRTTDAVGKALFRLNDDGTEVKYRLIVDGISNVVAAHIHIAVEGVNGPVVVFLAGPLAPGGGPSNGVLSEGSFTAANLVGPLAGQSLSVLLESMRNGGAYVNVHTNDGIDPQNTGAGDFPGGEVRGQIRTHGRNDLEPGEPTP
jgi:hypothetical protein